MLLLALEGQSCHWVKNYEMLIEPWHFCQYPEFVLSGGLVSIFCDLIIYVITSLTTYQDIYAENAD